VKAQAREITTAAGSVGDETLIQQSRISWYGEHPGELAKLIARWWSVWFGIVMVVGMIVLAVFAPLIAPHDPYVQDLSKARLPPFWYPSADPTHPLGTDTLGRDELSRLIYGSRVSLLVGFSAVALSAFIGISLGLISGYYAGIADLVIMRLTEFQLALPFILLALVVSAIFGPSLRNLIIILGCTGWVGYARVTRAEVLSARERQYVEAARAIGAPAWRILVRHILPNIASPLIVIATFTLAGMMIQEASLSFLGLGVQPPTPSWGVMLSDGREFLTTSWWLGVFPGIMIVLCVLGINLLGDWLRDLLDPRLHSM
jgi:peptide/nickel transport system permease protein